MKKFKIFVNFDKEEKWLNEMARNGWQLKGKSTRYRFCKGEPEATVIKVDYRVFNKRDAYEDYLMLFKDSGWEHICGNRSCGAQYFKKIDESSDSDIFSDLSSKAGRYKRLSNVWMSLAMCYLTIFISFCLSNTIDINALLHPKLLYYTPGLWERSGAAFWKAFLIETPIVLLRGFIWYLIPVFFIAFVIFALLSEKEYRKMKKVTIAK